jgi:hypothetical protein
MKSVKLGAACFAAAIAISGCRGERYHPHRPDNDDEEEVVQTIPQIQRGEVELGSNVTLKGVVVTGIDTWGKNTGGVWVQDPAGGEFSGITIRSGMDIVQGEETLTIEDLHVGDLVDVEGMYDEFALAADMSGDKISQINHPTRDLKAKITKTGKSAPVPEPADVDALLFATDRAEAERWESVLIRFKNVAIVEMPKSATSSDATLYEMRVSGPVIVQNGLFAFEKPDVMSLTPETCFGSIVGIGDYFFDYKLQPRSADDVVLVGGNCPPRTEVGLCDDMMDNDMDGDADTADPDCAVSLTIPEIQVEGIDPGPLNGTPVELENVVITAYRVNSPNASGVTSARRSYYVSTKADAASTRNSVLVFLATGVDYPLGAVVNVKGNLTEFNNETEIDMGELSCANGATTPAGCEVVTLPTPLAVTPAIFASEAVAEPYEHVTVKLTNVKFKEFNQADPSWTFTGKVEGADVTFTLENYAYGSSRPASCPWGGDGAVPPATPKCVAPPAGLCLSSLTGFVRYNKSKTRVAVNPFRAADIVPAANATDCD